MQYGARLLLFALALVGFGCGEPDPSAPGLSFAESMVVFPDTIIDHAGEQTIVLTNTGNAPVTASIAFSEDEAFTFKSSTCHEVAPGASCNVVVTFEPHSLGAHTVDLIANATGISVATTLVGVAVPELGLSSDGPVDFGGVLIGTPKTLRVTVLNGSNATARVFTVALAGTDAADFAITDDKCGGLAPAPHAPCTIDVTFTPSARSSRNAELVVTSANLGSVTIDLNGHGDAPAALSVSPDSGLFGSVYVLGESAPHTFTVTNTGDVESPTLQVSMSGANASDFTIADGCSGSTIAGGASCTFSIVYHASVLAMHEAAATITANGLAPIVVPLTAAGKPAEISITPANWDFGQVVVGQSSAPKTFTVQNTGSTNTGSLAVAFGAFQANTWFAVSSDACTGVDLPPNATCTVAVSAAPMYGGPRISPLLVGGTRGDKGVSDLQEEGLTPAMFTSTPLTVAFGDVPMAGNRSQFVIVENYGDLDTGTITVAVTGPDSADVSLVNETCTGSSLPKSGKCTMTVKFSPSHLGSETAAIEITSPGATLSIPVTANTIP